MSIQRGTRLGRYEIRSQLGRGGMGEVYLAYDTELERIVALKVLLGEVASDRQRMSRFTQEAKAASALNHPNILTIYEIGETSGTRFIATEFIDGVTLREALLQARMGVAQALDVSSQVASALAAAHAAGIVHRDIKPDNIMIRPDGYIKVLDFGLAKLTERKKKQSVTHDSHAPTQMLINTTPGVVMGTFDYMSPEQARGLEVDARTDIWSLGIVLYEMLTGRVPFQGETPSDVIASILKTEPPPLTRLALESDAELERIITKALRKKQEERYQTIKEMALDLKTLKQRVEFEAELERSLTPEESRERKLQASRRSGKSSAAQNAPTIIEHSSLLSPKADGHPNNLSVELTSLVGREEETAEVLQMLRRKDVRLLTLSGIGGTGKTRLAQRVAHASLREFADGVFFVELAAITDPALVASAIAQELGVKEVGGTTLKDTLKNHLRERQMLIVLDNFEQVVDAAPLVAELLASSPLLKVLVTSRVVLRLSAEHEYRVPPLALPETQEAAALPTLSELKTYAAVALFVERARAAKQNFTLTEENARPVVEVCRRLDGLPLAIELAAARVKLLQPSEILSRLDHRLKLLTGGARDLPARQQTMRSAISWSYDLLDAGERQLFRHLSVFAGGATMEAIEAVCGEQASGVGDWGSGIREKERHTELTHASPTPNPQPLTPAFEVLDAVASLVNKSLLGQKEHANGGSRFRMLELVREYALECLEQSAEADAVRERHARFYLALAEEAEPALMGAQQAEWYDKLEEEHDNLRSALWWLLDSDPASALRLAVVVRRLWTRHGHLTEGRGWLEAALAKSVGVEAQLRTKALIGAGEVTRMQGDLAAAHKFYVEALRVSREAGDRRLVAASSRGLGMLAYMQSDTTAARPLFEEALAAFRELGDKAGIASSLNALGELARTGGDLAAARTLYEEAVALARQMGNQNAMSVDLYNLGAVACLEGDLEAARACFRETIGIDQKLGDSARVSYSLDGFGALAVVRGEMQRAARLFGAAEHLRRSSGYELEPLDREFRDRYAAEARAMLGDQTYASAEQEGRALRMREAISLALDEPDSA